MAGRLKRIVSNVPKTDRARNCRKAGVLFMVFAFRVAGHPRNLKHQARIFIPWVVDYSRGTTIDRAIVLFY